MTPEAIVSLTAAISIALCFLEPAHANLTVVQTMQENRITDFDRIITGCKVLLQTCGRPRFLESVYLLWTQMSQSLYLLERSLWPEEAPETPLHVILPPDARPLSDILLDAFDPFTQCIFDAIQALETFKDWFVSAYDVNLHAVFHLLLVDSLLLFRTAEALSTPTFDHGTYDEHGQICGPGTRWRGGCQPAHAGSGWRGAPTWAFGRFRTPLMAMKLGQS
jgi:hypothetical protein